MLATIDRLFKLTQHKTTIPKEVAAGLTTFFTMAYILFVNPAILSSTGMDKGAVFTATCLVVVVGCLLAAFIANVPIAIAPGMALNTFFAYVVVGAHGFSWQAALAMVFISGICFILLTLTQFRRLLIEALPDNLKHGILIAISLLIAMIALKNSELILPSAQTLITLGNLKSMQSFFFILGFLLILVLDYYRVPGAILFSIIIITLISHLYLKQPWPSPFAFPPSIKPTFLALDLKALLNFHALQQGFIFLLIALFDATGTFIGLMNSFLFQEKKDNRSRISRGLLADSITTTFASLLGSSSTSPFLESAAGIAQGGRTGFTAIIIAFLFSLCLFFYPLVSIIPSYAINPILLYIACLMLKAIKKIEIDDMTDFVPAVITIIATPLTFSLADGLGLGIILYCLLKCLTGKSKEIHFVLYIIAILFVFYFYLS